MGKELCAYCGKEIVGVYRHVFSGTTSCDIPGLHLASPKKTPKLVSEDELLGDQIRSLFVIKNILKAETPVTGTELLVIIEQLATIAAKPKEPLRRSEMKEAAKRRPANFNQLSVEAQWMIDKELGILDWEGE